MGGSRRYLSNNEYQAAANSASPSAANPFVTVSSLPPGGGNIGSSDLAVDLADASRKLALSGNSSGEDLSFTTLGGDDILILKGDESIVIPTGYLGIGTSNVGPSFGGHKLTIPNATSSNAISLQQSGGNGKAISVLLTANTGSNVFGYYCISNNATSTTKQAIHTDITGSSTANLAWDLANGDVKLGTGTGSMWATADDQKQAWWGSTPVTQQILATGSSTDDVITFLQTVGLCKQS